MSSHRSGIRLHDTAFLPWASGPPPRAREQERVRPCIKARGQYDVMGRWALRSRMITSHSLGFALGMCGVLQVYLLLIQE